MITDELVMQAVVAYDNARCRTHGPNERPMSDKNRETIAPMIRAALEAVAPMVRGSAPHWLDDLPSEHLIAMHDHIHTIIDERAGNKISDARRRKAAAIRTVAETDKKDAGK